MKSEWNPAADPTSHLSRYLAFFQQPGINPQALREEVVKKFENPDMNLRDADELLERETTERLHKAHEALAHKLDRNSTQGAVGRPTPPGLYANAFYRSHDGELHRSKPMVLGDKVGVVSYEEPDQLRRGIPFGPLVPNLNHLFGKFNGGLSQGDLTNFMAGITPPVHKSNVMGRFYADVMRMRQEAKAQHVNVGTIGHVEPGLSVLTSAVRRVIGHDPGTDKFQVVDFEVHPDGTTYMIRGVAPRG